MVIYSTEKIIENYKISISSNDLINIKTPFLVFIVTFSFIHLYATVLPKIFWNLTAFQCCFDAESKTEFDNYCKKIYMYKLPDELQNVLRIRILGN